MGTATATSSAASKAGYSDAKQRAHDAFTDDDVQKAVDTLITVGLAAQPNGPAKATTYSYMKYGGIFAATAAESGVEEGVKAAGQQYVKDEAIGMAADGVVDGTQQAVQMAAESEVVSKGVESANKNLDGPSEQAMKDALGSMMSEGANALREQSGKDD